MTDVSHQINAAERTVGTRTLAAGEARSITITRIYAASIDNLWDALTNRERIPRWFLPITGDLRVGGRYQLEGNAGGTIERCDPPNSFAATWEYGGDVSWIEVRLTAASEDSTKTRFELEHIARVADERWTEFGPGAVGVGWDLALMGLGQHLISGASVDPAAAFAWMASDEGKRFIAAVSADWAEASIASGTDPAAARAAGERTTGFYTSR